MERLPRVEEPGPYLPRWRPLVVEVDEKGVVGIDGEALDMEGFRTRLLAEADGTREETGVNASHREVVLRVDRDLPWQGAQWLMQACGAPDVRIHRIHFGGVSRDGAREGTVDAHLPIHTGAAPATPEMNISIRAEYLAYGNPVTTADLTAHLDGRFPDRESRDFKVEIDAKPSVPTGDVVALVEAVRKWGANSVVFRGTSLMKEPTLEAAVARTPPRTGGLAITVLGRRVEPR
jgi:biopolymer transport protein ExbD